MYLYQDHVGKYQAPGHISGVSPGLVAFIINTTSSFMGQSRGRRCFRPYWIKLNKYHFEVIYFLLTGQIRSRSIYLSLGDFHFTCHNISKPECQISRLLAPFVCQQWDGGGANSCPWHKCWLADIISDPDMVSSWWILSCPDPLLLTHQQIDVTYIWQSRSVDRNVNVPFENWNWINDNYQE